MKKNNILSIIFLSLLISIFSLLINFSIDFVNEKEEVALNNKCDMIFEKNNQEYCFKNSTLMPIEFKCKGFINVKCKMFFVKEGEK